MNNSTSITALTVTQLNNQVKTSLHRQYQNIDVIGEINNLKKYVSGHVYFILKDEASEISCVMFNSYYQKLDTEIKNGDKVVLSGNVTLYLPKGSNMRIYRDYKNTYIFTFCWEYLVFSSTVS